MTSAGKSFNATQHGVPHTRLPQTDREQRESSIKESRVFLHLLAMGGVRFLSRRECLLRVSDLPRALLGHPGD